MLPPTNGPTAARAMISLGFAGRIVGFEGLDPGRDKRAFLTAGVSKVLAEPLKFKEAAKLLKGTITG